MGLEIDPEILAEIRRAAFELRREDPHGAVRVLRRLTAGGGDAEVLARGALGEIYLEEFGDLDGAEHEFRAVLAAAPGLPAAELGLSRVLRESGRAEEAGESLARAIAGLARDVESFRERERAGEPLPPGAEEVVLTLLEAAVEREELRREMLVAGGNGADETRPDEQLLTWAAQARLFDALEGEDGDEDDWVRFYTLSARLRELRGRAAEAAEILQAGVAQAEAKLAATPDPQARAGLEDAIRRYRAALESESGGLVQLGRK